MTLYNTAAHEKRINPVSEQSPGQIETSQGSQLGSEELDQICNLIVNNQPIPVNLLNVSTNPASSQQRVVPDSSSAIVYSVLRDTCAAAPTTRTSLDMSLGVIDEDDSNTSSSSSLATEVSLPVGYVTPEGGSTSATSVTHARRNKLTRTSDRLDFMNSETDSLQELFKKRLSLGAELKEDESGSKNRTTASDGLDDDEIVIDLDLGTIDSLESFSTHKSYYSEFKQRCSGVGNYLFTKKGVSKTKDIIGG